MVQRNQGNSHGVQGCARGGQAGWQVQIPRTQTKYPIFGSGVGSDVEPHKPGSYPTGVKPKAQRQVLSIHAKSLSGYSPLIMAGSPACSIVKWS